MNTQTKEVERQVYELSGSLDTMSHSPRDVERLKGMQAVINVVRACRDAGLDPFKHAQTVEFFEKVREKHSRALP